MDCPGATLLNFDTATAIPAVHSAQTIAHQGWHCHCASRQYRQHLLCGGGWHMCGAQWQQSGRLANAALAVFTKSCVVCVC